MKITIDTKHDSKEEIKKIIGLLNHLVDSEPVYSNSSSEFSNPFDIPNSSEKKEEPTNAFASMFGENSTPTETTEEPKDEEEKDKVSIFSLEEY